MNELMEKMRAQLERDRPKASGADSQQPAKFEMSDKGVIDRLSGWDLLLFFLIYFVRLRFTRGGQRLLAGLSFYS